MTSLPFRRAAAALLLAGLAACDDGGPVNTAAPTPGDPLKLQELTCRANLQARTVGCTSPTGGAGNSLIVGNQGVYVFLQSSNVAYNAGTEEFSFDVSVQNLIPQAMGTTDGTSAHADGVRVFFSEAPAATGGTGSITVINEDGTGTFTGSGQDYYQWGGGALGGDGILSSNETSSTKNWQFSVPNTVTTFQFKVYVAAEVQFPNGWIDLTPAADSLVEGGTQALTATVRTAVGNTVPGAVVSWGTSDGAVGTVDGSGLVTGVAPGSVTITATSGLRSGSAAIEVCPDLAVGEVYTASMPDAAGICFAGGASGNAEYTYMPVNLSSASALSLTLTGSGIVAVTGPPSPTVIPGGQQFRSISTEELDARDALHTRMMERERRTLSGLGADDLVRRGRRDARGPSRLITPGVPTVGDLWNLNVAQGCSGALDTRVGQVRSITNHVIVVADTANPPGGFTTAQYDSIALEFDSLAYAVDTAAFGGPTDIDTNQRVVAFYTRAVNELSPPASSVVVLGYFTARDLFSSAPASCPRSNEGEMFYMMVPDPTGVVNSNVRTVSSVRGQTVGTMAHELQHLINASRRIYLNGTWSGLTEEVWLNEGLSHIAEELVFYRASVGLAPRGNIIVTQLTTGPNASRRVAAFNAYANPNYGRLRPFLQRPDTAGALKNVDALAVRGATWSFLRYAADRKGGTENATWSSLVNTQEVGITNLTTVLGVDPTAWTRDWIAAMYADDAVAGISADYTNLSWNYRSIYTALNGSYQLVPRNLTNGVGLTLSYSRGGGTAWARFGVPTSGFAGLTALSGGVPPASPYALIVVRTK